VSGYCTVVAEGVERSARPCSEQTPPGATPVGAWNHLICYLASLGTSDCLSLLARPTSHKLLSPPARKESVSVPRFVFSYSFYFVLLYPSWASRPPTRTWRYHYRDLSLHLLHSPFVIIPYVHDGDRSFCAPFPSSRTHDRLFFRSRRSFQFLSCSLSLAAAAFTFAFHVVPFATLCCQAD